MGVERTLLDPWNKKVEKKIFLQLNYLFLQV